MPGREALGVSLGALGVLAFSVTLPATEVAERSFDPVVVGLGRAAVAAALAFVVLVARRQPLIVPALVPRLLLVVAGVVVGFPLLATLALKDVNSAHATVIVGLLPAATAGGAVLRAGERPRARYWAAMLFGVAAVLVFAFVQGAGQLRAGDALMLLAVAAAGLGYVEGAVLAREHGGWRVICWALLLAAPVIVPVSVLAWVLHPPVHVTSGALLGFGYVSVISMFLGFFAWYGGLARGGVARVGRLQLAQPVLTMCWAALLLSEHISTADLLAAGFVLLAVIAGRSSASPGVATSAPEVLADRSSRGVPAAVAQPG